MFPQLFSTLKQDKHQDGSQAKSRMLLNVPAFNFPEMGGAPLLSGHFFFVLNLHLGRICNNYCVFKIKFISEVKRETVFVHWLKNSIPTCYSDTLCTEAVLSCSCGLDLKKNIF